MTVRLGKSTVLFPVLGGAVVSTGGLPVHADLLVLVGIAFLGGYVLAASP